MSAPSVVHLFCGSGGGGLGFRWAGFRTVGAVDIDPASCADFEALVGFRPTCADLGAMSPDELRAACLERPDVVFTSPPCKGFSGCLPAHLAETDKYQALCALTLRGIMLALEAWAPSPPPLVLLENVPRILSRGRAWLDRMVKVLRAYGYTCKESTHDCGELGGLAQHRRRFLLVARHMEQCAEFLHVPPMRRVRGCGEVLGELPVPLPNSTAGGPMHRLNQMWPINWVRLALIPPGKDWRALPEAVALPGRDARQNGGFGVNDWTEGSHAVVAEGTTRNTWASVGDPRVEPVALDENEARQSALGVNGWDEAGHTVLGQTRHGNSFGSVADPRVTCAPRAGAYGVNGFADPTGAVVGAAGHDNGAFAVADPRLTERGNPSTDRQARHKGKLEVEPWSQPAHTIIAAASPHLGRGAIVADPRLNEADNRHNGKYGCEGWDEAAHTVIGESRTGEGWSGVADPRVTCQRRDGSMGVTAWDGATHAIIGSAIVQNTALQVADPRLTHETRKGNFGVTGWATPTHTIIGDGRAYKGQNVADPRPLPVVEGAPFDINAKKPCYMVIRAADGTWHRPLTTLELAVLQGFPAQVDGEWLKLAGEAHDEWRERIGNAVPPPTAEAIARSCAATLRAAAEGGLLLDSEPVWVDEQDQELRA